MILSKIIWLVESKDMRTNKYENVNSSLLIYCNLLTEISIAAATAVFCGHWTISWICIEFPCVTNVTIFRLNESNNSSNLIQYNSTHFQPHWTFLSPAYSRVGTGPAKPARTGWKDWTGRFLPVFTGLKFF